MMTLPQSEFVPSINAWLPQNQQPGWSWGCCCLLLSCSHMLPAAAWGQEGKATEHHSEDFFPSLRMNGKTRKLFSELGSSYVKHLGFRDNWVFLGAKGLQGKSPFEEVRGPICYQLSPSL